MRSNPSLPTVASQAWCGESCRNAGLRKWHAASFSGISWTAFCTLEVFSPLCITHEKQLGALPKNEIKLSSSCECCLFVLHLRDTESLQDFSLLAVTKYLIWGQDTRTKCVRELVQTAVKNIFMQTAVDIHTACCVWKRHNIIIRRAGVMYFECVSFVLKFFSKARLLCQPQLWHVFPHVPVSCCTNNVSSRSTFPSLVSLPVLLHSTSTLTCPLSFWYWVERLTMAPGASGEKKEK